MTDTTTPKEAKKGSPKEVACKRNLGHSVGKQKDLFSPEKENQKHMQFQMGDETKQYHNHHALHIAQ